MLSFFTIYRKLYPSLREHRKVEATIGALLAETLEERFIGPPPGRINPLRYAQKNFFSILFLAIYQAIGIPGDRRLFYGCLNHCLRGIVTGADNLLDNEYKEMLPLAFPATATKFKSVMHIMLFDRFLNKLAGRMADFGLAGDSGLLQDALFRAIVPIGAEEASEEGGVSTILPPEKILSSVHMYKGGRLLCLAFVAPRLLESELAAPLATAEKGVYDIGMALQMIDDLTDFYEDLRAGNHNYLVSTIAHRGGEKERAFLEQARERGSGPAVEEGCAASVAAVMAEAVGEALTGFARLEEAGFWLDQKQALGLIRQLFVLRGVQRLLPFFPNPDHPALHHAHVL